MPGAAAAHAAASGAADKRALGTATGRQAASASLARTVMQLGQALAGRVVSDAKP